MNASRYDAGENGLDRLATAVGGDCILAPLVEKVKALLAVNHWQSNLAAVMAVAQTAEVFDDYDVLDEMVNVVSSQTRHEKARVRHSSIHAIYQMFTDHPEHMQERWCKELLPLVAQASLDKVPRVRQRALWTLESLLTVDTDPADVKPHFTALIQALDQNLVKDAPINQLTYSISCIGALAKVMEADFTPHYQQTMNAINNCAAQYIANAKNSSLQAGLEAGKNSNI